MKPIRKTRHALMFMGAGALAAYFLDPEAGPARRDRVMDQVRSLTGDMGGSGSSDHSSGSDQSSAGSGTSSSGSGEVSAPNQGTADAFAGSSSEQRGSTQESGSGPIDLATGKPVSESPLGA